MNRLLLCVAALCGATVTGCYKRSPGPAALVEAEGPVRLVALPGGGPATDLVVMVRAGAAADPLGQEGVASLTARLLREGGAAGRSSEEVDAALYRLLLGRGALRRGGGGGVVDQMDYPKFLGLIF